MHRADVSLKRSPKAAITQAGLPLDRLFVGRASSEEDVQSPEQDPLFAPIDIEPGSPAMERYSIIVAQLQAAVTDQTMFDHRVLHG
jgi:hypothetical protein